MSSVKQKDCWYGTVVKSRLEIYAESNHNIIGVLREAKIIKIDHMLKKGFQGSLPPNLENKRYPEIEKPFRLRMNGGLIEILEISDGMGWQEETLLKGILAALQYDAISIYAEGFDYTLGVEEQSGAFQSEENGVAGKCRTFYKIVPKDINAVKQSVLRVTSSKQPVELFEITRTTNLSHCVKGMAFEDAVLASTHHKAGDFSKRSTVCRTVIDRSSNAIYSSHLFTNVLYKPVNGFGRRRRSIQSSVKIVLTSLNKARKNDNVFKLSSNLRSGSILYSISKTENYSRRKMSCYSNEKQSYDYMSKENIQPIKYQVFKESNCRYKRGFLRHGVGCQDKEQPLLCATFDCYCAHLFATTVILLLPV